VKKNCFVSESKNRTKNQMVLMKTRELLPNKSRYSTPYGKAGCLTVAAMLFLKDALS